MTGPLPDGVGVALVTIFDANGDVDVAATTDHAVSCVERGVRSVLVAGTTGEPWRLTGPDRIALAAAIKDALPEVPVLVGTGDRTASIAVDLTRTVAGAGAADALVVLAPTDMAALDLYSAIRSVATDTPVVAYHLPALSPPGVDAGAVASLPVDAIKDSSGDTDRLARLLHDGVTTFVGSPTLLAVAGPCGARGALVALANTHPEACVAAWAGDGDAQRRLLGAHVASMVDFPECLKPARPSR